MNEIIDKRTIFLDQTFSNKQEVLEVIAKTSVHLNIADSEVAILEELVARENMLSTSVGKGIAIPHCKSKNVKSSKIFLYRLSKEINWDEDEPVSLVFAILTNSDNSDHLSILAKLSRNLLKENFLGKVKAATSSEEIYEQLTTILN
ncbi:PTS sugar transporter subunit IIA [Enterococcus saccharolyticus]|uniref:PTS sugar transporter subunit IIA n=1 Tax=Enterococcus TaxID=1350 RepID=UPI001E5086C3|nr:PTS sugar transporter subunit IIA [Enterococcus saccharolyticus]MCD5001675.1 PTS sugar transporter subunit IIA [Enterococcus saccharolyticus]